ncbi:hypothetical protein [Pedobacter rhizosphaerae]|nr:hypothetical protein [Pedobacter rhizosphaerae]
MMKLLRNSLLRSVFGVVLLAILLIKTCAFSISYFSSSEITSALEKNAAENKDKEEESFDKTKKKLLLYESSIIDQGHPLWTNHLPLRTQPYRLRIGNPPPKNVPTPPPDHQS